MHRPYTAEIPEKNIGIIYISYYSETPPFAERAKDPILS